MNDKDAKFFVYFAAMPDGLVKIGTSSNLARRISTLKADLIHFIEGSSFRESAIHYLMRSSNEKGEYFRHTEELAGFISALKRGDFGLLIDEVPKAFGAHSYISWGTKKERYRCFRVARDALGLSITDVAKGAGVSEASAKCADSFVAPELLSGRFVQYIVGKAAERGLTLGSHHFTGLYDRDLKVRLSWLKAEEIAA